jgi:hypothetical protein
MIFGDAALMEVPWETLLKEYRKELGDKSFSTIDDYSKDLLAFLVRLKSLFSESRQRMAAASMAAGVFAAIRSEIDDNVKDRSQDKKVTESEIGEIVANVVEEWKTYLDGCDFADGVDDGFVGKLINEFCKEFDEAWGEAIGELKRPPNDTEVSRYIAAKRIATGGAMETGLVVAGFGSDEMFPAVRTVRVKRIVLDTVLYSHDADESHKIDLETSGAALLPFAQRDVVIAFLTGCESSYIDMMANTLNEIFDQYPNVIIRHLADSSVPLEDSTRDAIRDRVNQDMGSIKKKFFDRLSKYKNDKHILPLLDVIAALPKDELASMAEALVNLTAVKRQMALDIETVGGPIDVAVISRGDGFIWIKRKHYFSSEFNPHFTSMYFKR